MVDVKYQPQTRHPYMNRPKWHVSDEALPRTLVTISQEAAGQLLTWRLGDPHTEWCCLAMVDDSFPEGGGYQATIGRLFFCDAGMDHVGGTTMPPEWLNTVWDTIDREGLDATKLFGHIHSHGRSPAFHSDIDDQMVANMLDEQSALTSRKFGRILTIVIGEGRNDTEKTTYPRVSLDCNLSRWRRKDGKIDYERWELPVAGEWPAALPIEPIMLFSERVKGKHVVPKVERAAWSAPSHKKKHGRNNVVVFQGGKQISMAEDDIVIGSECVGCSRPLFKSELIPPSQKIGLCYNCEHSNANKLAAGGVHVRTRSD